MGPFDSGSTTLLAREPREEVSLVYKSVFGTKPCLRSPSGEQDPGSGAEHAAAVAGATDTRSAGSGEELLAVEENAGSTVARGTWVGATGTGADSRAGSGTGSGSRSPSGTPSPPAEAAPRGAPKRVTWADQLGHSSLAPAPQARPRMSSGTPSSDPGPPGATSTVSPLWLGASRIPLPPATSAPHVSKAAPRRAPWLPSPDFSVVRTPLKPSPCSASPGPALPSSHSRAARTGTPPASSRSALSSRGWMAGLVSRLNSGSSSSSSSSGGGGSSSEWRGVALGGGTPAEAQASLARSCSVPAQRTSPADSPTDTSRPAPYLPWESVAVSNAPQRTSSLPHPGASWGAVPAPTPSQAASQGALRVQHPVYPRHTNGSAALYQHHRGNPWARDAQPWPGVESPGRARILRVRSAGHGEPSSSAAAAAAAAAAATATGGGGAPVRRLAAEAPGAVTLASPPVAVTLGTPPGLARAFSYQPQPVWNGHAGLLSPQGTGSPAWQYRRPTPRADPATNLGGTPGAHVAAPRTPPGSFARGPRLALGALLEADATAPENSPPGVFLEGGNSDSSNCNSTGPSNSNSTSSGSSNGIGNPVPAPSAGSSFGGCSRPGVGRFRAPAPQDSAPAQGTPGARGAAGAKPSPVPGAAGAAPVAGAPGAPSPGPLPGPSGGAARQRQVPGRVPGLGAEEGAEGAAAPGNKGVTRGKHSETSQNMEGVPGSLSWVYPTLKSHGGASHLTLQSQSPLQPQPQPQPQPLSRSESQPQSQPLSQPKARPQPLSQSRHQVQSQSQPHPVLVLGLTPQPIFTAAYNVQPWAGPEAPPYGPTDTARAVSDTAHAEAQSQVRQSVTSRSQQPPKPQFECHQPQSASQAGQEVAPPAAPGAGEGWSRPLPSRASGALVLRPLQSRQGFLHALLAAPYSLRPGQEGSQEASFRALLDLAGLGFIVVSLGPLRLEDCSALFARRLGVYPGKVAGMPLNSLLAPWQIGLPPCPKRGKSARYLTGYSDSSPGYSDGSDWDGVSDIWSRGVAEGLRTLLAASGNGLQEEVHFVSHSSGDYVPTLLTLRQPPSAPAHSLAQIACGIVEFL